MRKSGLLGGLLLCLLPLLAVAGLKSGCGLFGFGVEKASSCNNPVYQLNFIPSGTPSLDPSITFTRASTDECTNASGILVQLSNNVPCFDYTGTGAALGLRIEQSSTNGLRNSSSAGASTPSTLPTHWTASGPTGVTVGVAATGTLANGMAYTDISFVGTTTQSGVFLGILFDSNTQVAASSGQIWTGSAYTMIVSGSLPVACSLDAQFLTSGGGFLSNNLLAYSSPSTLTRLSVTGTAPASTGAINFVFTSNSAVGNGVPVNFTIRFAYPQVEQLPFATSIIPTSSGAVTRAADSAVVSSVPWFNSSAGTVVVSLTTEGSATSGVFSFDDGSANNRIDYRNGSGLGLISAGGVQQASLASGNFTPGTPSEVGVSYSATGAGSVLNGGSLQTSGAITLPTGIDELQIGNIAGGGTISAWYKSLEYFNRQLNNSQFQQVAR